MTTMAAVKISNSIGTSINEYPSEGLAIFVDDVQCYPAAGATAAGAAIATQQVGYESEMAQLFRVWNGTVNKDGMMMAKDGSVMTVISKDEALNDTYPSVQALIDDAMMKNYTREVRVDGTVVQQGLQPPAGFGSQTDGTLKALQINPVAPPAVPQTALRLVNLDFPSGDINQTMVDVTGRVGAAPVAIKFTVPQGATGSLRIRGVEFGAGRRTLHEAVVSKEPGDFTGSAKGVEISIDCPVPAPGVYFINVRSSGVQPSDIRVHLALFPS